MAADLLQSTLNEALQNDLISNPLMHNNCPDFPIIQYADDTLLVLNESDGEIMHIVNILLYFVEYTGLKVNYSKFLMVPINVTEDKLLHLAVLLNCKIG